MTRYGFAIKALPKGGKPFGDDEEDQDHDTAAADGADTETPPGPAAPGAGPAAGSPADEAPEDEADPGAAPAEEAPGAPTGAPPEGEEAEVESSEEAPPAPEDDARPWSGDMYDEGDETDPAAAFAAYQGANGEEAWLDQAPDGTLTGWVRDATGQVWRYTDPDVWAIDVDDAQMTRTHSHASGDAGDGASAEHGGQDPLFPPKQQS
ncbi:hypothetical protein [Streptomyces sp. ISL-100]|uniref:hypothetical protein n=1 Tax=Streptomyces sp. ISL-100 TaxID=2819173 RepID=UPI001BEB9E63|nr:hypothetical protein [Streptomyces sp. ISL-100]MBT2395236.1 hypothetical protein [Streptomyces sp. ISL-100]